VQRAYFPQIQGDDVLPDISEFSYGFALVNELINSYQLQMVGAPQFPTQNEEGQTGGYDVCLPRPGVPVFLQVKRSECLVRRSAAQAAEVGVPHYRMHLRPLRHSRQHELLRELELSQPEVYYATPRFHTHSELDDAYQTNLVGQRSTFVKPSEIGVLPDDGDHHVAISADGATWLVCSRDPRKLHAKRAEEVIASIAEAARTRSRRIDGAYLEQLGDKIVESYVRKEILDAKDKGERAKMRERAVRQKAGEVRGRRRPDRYAREVANTLLGCELLFALMPT
jgi:hypothetical protein